MLVRQDTASGMRIPSKAVGELARQRRAQVYCPKGKILAETPPRRVAFLFLPVGQLGRGLRPPDRFETQAT